MMRSDLYLAIRSLTKQAGFSIIAILTLALGFGACTTFFSVLYGVVLRDPSYPGADRLVAIRNVFGDDARDGGTISMAELRDYRARQRSFVGIAADSWGRATLATENGAERVLIARVTANLFPLLGVAPMLGRDFTPAEERPAADHVVILSYGCWQSLFGGAPDVLGRSVRLNGEEFTIVGVMPPGFGCSEPGTSFWSPINLEPQGAAERTERFLFPIARLLPGTSVAQARRDLAGVARQLQADLPQYYRAGDRWSLGLVSLRESRVAGLAAPFGALMVGAAAVLLIACVNVAIMFLLRAASRRREIMIRLALGASRRHVVRQLLAESLVVCTIGMTVGLALAVAGVSLLKAFPPGDIPRLQEVALSGPVAAFAAAVLVAVTVLVGLAPAASVLRSRISEGITHTARTTESRGAVRMREALIVLEVALAMLLLLSAGLTLRSFRNLLGVEMGFRTEHVLSFKTNLVERAYPNAESANRFYEQLTAKLAALPGVTGIGAVSSLPLSGESQFIHAAPAEVSPDTIKWDVGLRVVRDAYFQTMGLVLVRGRTFGSIDQRNTIPVAIVDEELAQRFWPGVADVLGRQIRLGRGGAAETRTVVGVVRNVHHFGPREEAFANTYVPQSQYYQRGLFTVVRTANNPDRLVPLIRAALAEVDPTVPMYFTATMERRYDDAVALPRFIAGLIAAFSVLALLLAGVGIFGVTAYSVGQRTREFGIRVALGAQRTHLVNLVLGRVGRLALIGGTLGAIAALEVGGLMKAVLFGVAPTDSLTLAFAVIGTVITAVIASLVPLTRALRVNPIECLRAE